VWARSRCHETEAVHGVLRNDEDLAIMISRSTPPRRNVPWNVAVTNAITVILQAPPTTITTDPAIDEEERDPLSTRMIMITGNEVAEDKGRHLMGDDLLPPIDIATVGEIMTMKIAIDDDDDLWGLNRHRDVLEDGEEGVHEGGMQGVALRLIPRDLLL
jgi:hypothetical protein